jgi:hypothetical protein
VMVDGYAISSSYPRKRVSRVEVELLPLGPRFRGDDGTGAL